MSKEAIIDKIIADATARATAMINEAKYKADGIKNSADSMCAAYKTQSESDTSAAVADIKKRGRTVAELDAKKIILKAKAEIIDGAFALALNKVKEIDAERYKKLIIGMLAYADDGDSVTLSNREKGVITEADIAEIAKKRGIKLNYVKTPGNFDGGVILTGKGVDKNLTLDVEFAVLRDELEAEIAKELFN